MTHSRRDALRLAALLPLGLPFASIAPAAAQGGAWPDRPVKLIVPWPAGGPTDTYGRALSRELSAQFGQPFVVDNRTGATGTIGIQYAARSAPDGKTLYVAETDTARLWSFAIQAPGRLELLPFPSPHGGRLVCGLPGFQRFDSLAVEAGGNICVATLITGCITVISPRGELLEQVKLPDVYVTNLCFGGPDLCTAYVTLAETGRVARLPWPRPGLALNFQK